MNFAEQVIRFNQHLHFTGKLPAGIKILNPFKEDNHILTIAESFYRKFYNDSQSRKFIIGINPGRLGAGATGIPFTDTKRLFDKCNIKIASFSTHEPSSVFVYEMIEKYGGVEKFYSQFYINSICPLGFVRLNEKNNWVNCNYYDYPELFSAMKKFITRKLKEQVKFGIDTSVCYVLGKKNEKFFHLINDQEKIFNSVIVLEHPRYIIQYKLKEKDRYIVDYLEKLKL